jgi:rhodanese-related sulfurtransferase
MTSSRQGTRDLAGVVGLVIFSLVAGLVLNHFRAKPLALAYKSPEQRLQAELAELVSGPPLDSFPVSTISLDEFRQIVQSKSELILDARDSLYYRQGHVPGSLNLSRDNFGHDYLRLRSMLEKDKKNPIVVYCSGGTCHDSKMVAQALLGLGFTNVRIFPGGWEQWSAAGLPAQRG